MLKLFASSMTAALERPGVLRTVYRPGAFIAHSKYEDEGMAMETCKGTWPALEGWSRHSVEVVEIPQAMIERVGDVA